MKSLHPGRRTTCDCGKIWGELSGESFVADGQAYVVGFENSGMMRAIQDPTREHRVEVTILKTPRGAQDVEVNESLPPTGDGDSTYTGDISTGLPGTPESLAAVGEFDAAASPDTPNSNEPLSVAELRRRAHAALRAADRSATAADEARAYIERSLGS